MLRTYRYRLYPTAEQESALNDILWVACALYNAALHYRRMRWQESRHRVTYNEQAAMWRDWRNEDPGENPLRLLNMTAGQQVLCRLDSAFKEFFQGKRGFPAIQESQPVQQRQLQAGRRHEHQGPQAVRAERWTHHRALAPGAARRAAQEHHHRVQAVWLVCLPPGRNAGTGTRDTDRPGRRH
jgi:putative transposase